MSADIKAPRWPELNERYRAEGWGKVAEAALGTYPENVEAQAREVARYAHAEISRARSEYERVLALLAEARADFGRVRDEALMGVSHGLGDRVYSISSGALSRIDDALAADAEARG